MKLTRENLTPNKMHQARAHLREALAGLHQCWDSLGLIENLFNVEIETDELSNNGLTICSGDEITDDLLTETLIEVLVGKPILEEL